MYGFIVPPGSIKEAMEKNIYRETIEVEFEGVKLKAPIEYNKHLKNIFGNYMELPPESQRISNHNFKAYFKGSKDENYKYKEKLHI